MEKELRHFILYTAIICLAVGALNSTVAASQSLGGHGTHVCGVIDGQWDKRRSDQFFNRHYAQSFAANFNSVEPHTVRLIYFLPNDRAPQRDIDTKLDWLIKDAQQSFAEVMQNHGLGRKTFQFEMDASGKAIVHHMTGRFPDAYYSAKSSLELWDEVWIEVSETFEGFDLTTNVYFAVMDISSESFLPDDGDPDYIICGRGGYYGSFGGRTLMPASGKCFNVRVATHELGHAFGLKHDRVRNAIRRPSSYHADSMTSTFCAAEWLAVHRYFNIGTTYPSRDSRTEIRMSSLPASSTNAIRLRFEITDADGLHQAQLYWIEDVIACQGLNGQSVVYEFELIPALHGISNEVTIRVIDVHGNFIRERYPIDITALLPSPTDVLIQDTNLATAIRQALRLAPSDALTQSNLTQLVSLDASSRGIRNLSGLEHATQLQTLILSNNKIANIDVLAGLSNLTELNLGPAEVGGQWMNNNAISDISALRGLTRLVKLDLAGNFISDISPLAGLTNMDILYLGTNSISDISPLAGLTNLTWLDLGENSISDISVLAGFTHLTNLWLWVNAISDISPLVANTGLGSGDAVYLQFNPLSYQSLRTHIRTLQSRGVTVEFDNQAYSTLVKISGDNQTGPAGAALSDPFVVKVQDGNSAALAGISVVFTVIAGNGTLRTTHTTTNTNGRARSTLTLGPNPGTNTVEVSASGIEGTVTFTAVAGAREGIRIPDSNLRAVISAALGVAPSAQITQSMMATLTYLNADNAGITDLTGLEFATDLTLLNLGSNNISDLSTIADLTNLISLDLRDSDITDISVVAGLTNLTSLDLRDNSVSDISSIAKLTKLTWLNLKGNSVSDLSAITRLTELAWLNLRDNSVSDMSPLAVNTGLGNGDTVSVKGNPLSDQSINTHIASLQNRGVTVEFDQIVVPPKTVNIPDSNLRNAIEKALSKARGTTITVAEMETLTALFAINENIRTLIGLEHATKLTVLDLRDNSISNIAPLAGLTNLTVVRLARNNIAAISSVAGLTNLTVLNFRDNSISDISFLTGLTNLTVLRLDSNSISDLSPLLANTGLESGDTVHLKGNPLSNLSIKTHIPTLQSKGVTVEFDQIVVPPQTVNIPDPNLRNAIEKALSKARGAAITVAEMEALTALNATHKNITNLTGLEAATNLRELDLRDNSISDLSPLAGLPQLTYLNFEDNAISDLSPLVANTSLGDGQEVHIKENPLSTVSINIHIPTLQSRGVIVEFDSRLEIDPNKITGPWLWMIAPTQPGQGGRDSNNVDSLAAGSDGNVTEAGIAANGAKEGDAVGNYVWTLGKIAGTGSNNINAVINAIGMARGDVNHHSSYALITLESVTAQSNVTMRVGSDDSIKVWLNGAVVHNNPINRAQQIFRIVSQSI